MDQILALDPGTEQTGYMMICGNKIARFGVLPNDEILEMIRTN